MKKLMNIILTTFATILIVSVGQLNHVSAMPNQSDMHMLDDGGSISLREHCSVSHMGVAERSELQQKDIKKRADKDTEPCPPYYLQFSCSDINSIYSHKLTYTPQHSGNTKVPPYRLYGVIRR